MSFFHWNPIRRNAKDVENHMEFTNLPTTFVPRNYVQQRKRRLYNNLLVLLGGLSALTISHDMDIFETETRVKLRNILTTSGQFFSHLVAVPLIIRKLHLHYSIILGAMGMSVTHFFYYIENPIILSILICLRIIFVALFDVSAMIYVVKLARISSRIQGNALYSEILTARCFKMIFVCMANILSSSWRQYNQEPELRKNPDTCGSNFCPGKALKRIRLAGTMSTGQNTIFVALAIVVSLSGMILIAMYLKPITSLDYVDPSDEPRNSSPLRILKQLAKPKAKQLTILITSCIFMHEMIDEFVLSYISCSMTLEYHRFFIECTKELLIMFGAMSCLTLVDLTGFHWLYKMTLLGQFLSHICLVLWEFAIFKNQLSHMIVYHVICTSISVEMSILQLYVIQTLGDEEISAWCFYHVIGDTVYLLRTIADIYLCTGVKLWISIAMSPIAIIAVVTYSCQFDGNFSSSDFHLEMKGISLYECCSLLIKTSRKIIAKSVSFDLKIIVEKSEYIRKVETFLERKYTLKSRSLVPPADDLFTEKL